MAKTRKEILHLDVSGQAVPVWLFRERRRSMRIAKGKKAFLLRIPNGLSPKKEQEAISWARRWMQKQFNKNPAFARDFQPKSYHSGTEIRTTQKTYVLELVEEDRKTIAARLLDEQTILIRGPHPIVDSRQYTQVISRILAADQLPDFQQRVQLLNNRYFQESFKQIRLKYTRSRWGSCSSDGNLNFSTRLLLAPQPVMDYVIIHELAHLKELNHSAQFWSWVEKACPTYRVQEKWLKENREACEF